MRNKLRWILGAWAFATAPAFAQTPPPPAPPPYGFDVPANPVDQPASSGMPSPSFSSSPDSFRFWVHAEYLAYWVKSAPVPVSIVTGDPNNPTQELLNSNQNLGMFSGYRVGVGGWFDAYGNLGMEANFWALQRRTQTFSASSDENGSPILAFPFVNQTPGAVGDMFMPITSPGQFAGSVAVISTLQLWGTEFNGVVSLARDSNFEFTGIFGFRYVNLQESLDINTLSSALMTTPNTVLFQSDQFDTRNQFYGGQIGARFSWQNERLGFDVTGKVALGATHQTVNVQGYSAQTGPGGVNGVFPGGFFAQPSNMGSISSNQFTVIPSVELKFYVFLTSQLRAFVGYDFMYWSSVVRPGNQIDRNINLSQSAIYGNGALMGPASPGPLFNRTDFWAQGLNFGLELRF